MYQFMIRGYSHSIYVSKDVQKVHRIGTALILRKPRSDLKNEVFQF